MKNLTRPMMGFNSRSRFEIAVGQDLSVTNKAECQFNLKQPIGKKMDN